MFIYVTILFTSLSPKNPWRLNPETRDRSTGISIWHSERTWEREKKVNKWKKKNPLRQISRISSKVFPTNVFLQRNVTAVNRSPKEKATSFQTTSSYQSLARASHYKINSNWRRLPWWGTSYRSSQDTQALTRLRFHPA